MNINKRNLKNYQHITKQMTDNIRDHGFHMDEILKKYNLDLDSDSVFNDPNYYEYIEELGQFLAKYEIQQSILNTKRVAELLIGYNIAHRGKKLHPSAITKKLRKLPELHAKTIYLAINDSHFNSPVLTAKPYLHSVLYEKYGVLFLDKKYFGYLHTMLNDPRIEVSPKQREKIIAKLKLFHSTTVKSYLNEKQK